MQFLILLVTSLLGVRCALSRFSAFKKFGQVLIVLSAFMTTTTIHMYAQTFALPDKPISLAMAHKPAKDTQKAKAVPKATEPPKTPPKVLKGYWRLPGGSEQQNAALRVYQDALKARGVTDPEALHLGAALLVHENEKLTVDRISFTGFDFGLCQMNTGKVPSRIFMQLHPEWLDVKKQAGWCADRFVKTYDKYDQSIFRAVVQNHCPACAAKGVDSKSFRWHGKSVPLKPPYYQRVKITAKKLTLL